MGVVHCCDGGQQLGSLAKKLSEGQLCRAVRKGEMGHALPKTLPELSITECKAAFTLLASCKE